MAAKEVRCGDEWLPGTGVLCQNDPHEYGMHWGKYHINYDKCGLVGEGEIWWNSQIKKEGTK